MCNLQALEAVICRWPGVQRRVTKTQIVLSREGVSFAWLSPSDGKVQIAPSLGLKVNPTRYLERHEARVKVVRRRTGRIDAEYHDPGRKLERTFSYPGFKCSQTPQDQALSLVRQAYEWAARQGSNGPRAPGTAPGPRPSGNRGGDPPPNPNKVVQVPMEAEMIQALDSWSEDLGRSRADIIREACRRYLKYAEREKLDRIYREGYDRVPEEPILALTQAALLAEVLPKEEW